MVEHLGGKVVFCDIDLGTFNIDIDQIESKITSKTKAIFPVHLFGLSADMDPILELAHKHNLFVVEDAACGFGSKYKGRHVGNFGDTGCFSFHPRKAITTGEGGMVTTNDSNLADKIRRLRDHGAAMSDLQRHLGARPYLLSDHPDAGYNQRMTDLQAALGISQLRRLDEFVAARHRLADRYDEELSSLPLKLPTRSPDARSALHLYPIQVQQNRKEIFTALRDAEIGVSVHYIPIHLQPDYARYGFKEGDFPEAEAYYKGAISLPMFSSLRDQDQDYVISRLKLALEL